MASSDNGKGEVNKKEQRDVITDELACWCSDEVGQNGSFKSKLDKKNIDRRTARVGLNSCCGRRSGQLRIWVESILKGSRAAAAAALE